MSLLCHADTMIDRFCWTLLALVHLMPSLALFRPVLLTRLYQIEPGNPLFILMHHRAALFLCVFAACVWAAIDAQPRPLATLITAVSMISFLVLYWMQGSPPALRQIAIVDLIGLVSLGFVVWRAFAGR